MKKQLLFTFLSFAIANGMQSQITITDGNIFGIGDTFNGSTDTNYTATITGGANQTWDFSNLNSDFTGLYEGIDPATTPNASDYPNATLAFRITEGGETSIAYIHKNSSKAEMLGFDGAFSIKLDNPQTILEFPSTFNSSFSDISGSEYSRSGADFGFPPSVDSVKVKNNESSFTIFDAFGSMTTPLGTVDVIRAFETRMSVDSTWVLYTGTTEFALVGSGSDTSYAHAYWGNDPSLKFPVVEYRTNAAGTSVGGSVTFVSQTESTLSINSIDENSFTIFPNPVASELNIQTDNEIQTIDIFDISGRKVISKTSSNQTTLNVSDLKSGMYTISIFSNGKWQNQLFNKQ